nr:hypothetical protein I308_05856 [Cryptococcus tetragattii IND107]
MIPFYKPIPAPPAIFKDQPLPEQNANFLPKILFHWVTPVMKAGYSRLLEADDLWNLATDLKCKTTISEPTSSVVPPIQAPSIVSPSCQSPYLSHKLVLLVWYSYASCDPTREIE